MNVIHKPQHGSRDIRGLFRALLRNTAFSFLGRIEMQVPFPGHNSEELMAGLPSLEDQLIRQRVAYLQAEDHVFRTQIRPRITPEIVEEHRRNPIGKHSDDLERVLIYLRKHHQAMRHKYILVCTKPHEEWRIARINTEPDTPPTLLDDTFTDRFEAEHGVFRKRLADNGLLPDESGATA